jgi:hypothetical protein
MTRSRFRPYRRFAALAVFSVLLTGGGAEAAAKPAAKATTKPKPAGAEGGSASDAAAAPAAIEEATSSGAADAPSGTSTEVTATNSTSTAASTSASTGTETAESPPKAEANSATTGGEAPAAQPVIPFIEEMGPATFPGRSRGLPGGSLWLEPSFHGLQWPQNTRTGIAYSGMFWIDSGYATIVRDRSGTPAYPDSRTLFQQGRGLLRVTPAYVSGSFFIQGQIELAGNLCRASSSGLAANPQPNTVCQSAGTFSTDDLWIRFGQWNLWDVKVGSFEAWEVYHLGMGMEPYTLERLGAGMFGVDSTTSPRLEAPSLYALNYMHDRPADGLAVGYVAGHAYVTDYLRFELLAKLGNDNYRTDKATGDTAFSYYGGRPTAILDLGWLKLKVGAEYHKRKAMTQIIDNATLAKKDSPEERTNKGVGASVQFVFAPYIEFGLNAAVGQQEHVNEFGNAPPYDTLMLGDSWTTRSMGGFANLRLADGWLAGVGANWTEQLDKWKAPDSTANDYTSHLQGFAAFQYLLAGQLYIKAVFGYAKADFQPSSGNDPVWKNQMVSGRVRLMYLY